MSRIFLSLQLDHGWEPSQGIDFIGRIHILAGTFFLLFPTVAVEGSNRQSLKGFCFHNQKNNIEIFILCHQVLCVGRNPYSFLWKYGNISSIRLINYCIIFTPALCLHFSNGFQSHFRYLGKSYVFCFCLVANVLETFVMLLHCVSSPAMAHKTLLQTEKVILFMTTFFLAALAIAISHILTVCQFLKFSQWSLGILCHIFIQH